MFSEDGHFIKKINCNNPYAICLTPDDYIITGTGGDRSSLTVFSPTHQLITKFGTYGSQRGQFSNILGIAVNSVGTIFVTEGIINVFKLLPLDIIISYDPIVSIVLYMYNFYTQTCNSITV